MPLAPQNIQTAPVNLAASGALIPADPNGRRIVVVSFLLMIPAGMTIKIQDGAADRTGPLTAAAAWGLAGAENELGHWQTTPGAPLNANLAGGSGAVIGWISYALL
jgi:hypothetical protein